MSQLSKSGKSPKTELGRERIVIEALALIDEKGLSSLSMRTLASRLSVYPSAIYWYVKSRNGLLAAIVEHVLADILPDAEELDWQAWVFTLMQSYRSAVMRHPNIAPLLGADLASNIGVDINVVDKLLRVLEKAGFSGDSLMNAYNSVMAGMIGFVTLELSATPADEQWVIDLRSRFSQADPERFPTIARLAGEMGNRAFVIRWVSGKSAPLDAAFESFGDALILGLKAQLGETDHYTARAASTSKRRTKRDKA